MSEFNYLTEKRRYLESIGVKKDGNSKFKCNGASCNDCMFGSANNYFANTCEEYEFFHPEEATELLRRWSNEHPVFRNVDYVAKGLKNLGYHADVNYMVENRCPPHMTDTYFNEGKIKCDNNCELCRKWWLEEYKDSKEIKPDVNYMY